MYLEIQNYYKVLNQIFRTELSLNSQNEYLKHQQTARTVLKHRVHALHHRLFPFLYHFLQLENFLDMENFLECADSNFTSRIDDLSSKMDTLHEEYIRTSTVYEINNKKRLKEEELLLIERQKI